METAFLWWYAADSTIPLCNNRVYISNLKILESQIKDKLEVQAFHTIDKIDRMLFERFMDIKVIATDPVISSRNSTPKQIRERLIEYKVIWTYFCTDIST